MIPRCSHLFWISRSIRLASHPWHQLRKQLSRSGAENGHRPVFPTKAGVALTLTTARRRITSVKCASRRQCGSCTTWNMTTTRRFLKLAVCVRDTWRKTSRVLAGATDRPSIRPSSGGHLRSSCRGDELQQLPRSRAEREHTHAHGYVRLCSNLLCKPWSGSGRQEWSLPSRRRDPFVSGSGPTKC